jgi:hypothetical protein
MCMWDIDKHPGLEEKLYFRISPDRSPQYCMDHVVMQRLAGTKHSVERDHCPGHRKDAHRAHCG